MKKFYRNLFQVYFFMARALFPKDSALQREFLLIKVSALEKEMPEIFEKLGGVRLLRHCRSAQEMKKLVEHIKENDWFYVMKMLKTMQSMQEDPKLASKISLNKAAFVLDQDIREGKAEDSEEDNDSSYEEKAEDSEEDNDSIYEEKAKDFQKINTPRYKKIWRQYRGVAHLIVGLQIMKLQYLELTGDPIPFEAFLALALDHLNLAAYQEGEELKKMYEGHTKKPIVPADEFYAIKRPKLAENELATLLLKKCILTDSELRKKISKYRAPVFDYGNFDIPNDN
ncbi:MAG: hypothetical protein II942_05175 [Alphaproteobacteria bacterium]|nr:hypothetical protein [Alphaproteobacteria bacterium]